MESFAEKGLRETRAFMGSDASLLQYLPTDKVREGRFEDRKRERPNSLSLRILFGQLQEGENRGAEVWILLYKAHTEERWPEHRFNIFDHSGRLIGGISIEDAVRQTNAANAFKWLKTSGTMDMSLLRAIIKYYFMVKKADPLMPWPVDARFASHLTAACKLARKLAEKVANNKQTDKDHESATNAMCQSRPSITAPQAGRAKSPTNQLRTEMTTSTNKPKIGTTPALTRAQSMSHRSSIRSASSQPTRSLPFEDGDSLFVPEQPRRAATPLGFKSHVPSTSPKNLVSESEHVEEYRRAFQRRMLPEPASTPRSLPSAPRSNPQSSPVREDAGRMNNTAPSVTSKPVSENRDTNGPLAPNSTKQQKDSANQHSPITFVSAYRKADAEGEIYVAKLQDIDKKTRKIKAEITVLETRLRNLEVEERNIKSKHKDIQMSKKRLHDELTPESRELLRFGIEIAEREFKRSKTGAHQREDDDEWRITQELGCGQKD